MRYYVVYSEAPGASGAINILRITTSLSDCFRIMREAAKQWLAKYYPDQTLIATPDPAPVDAAEPEATPGYYLVHNNVEIGGLHSSDPDVSPAVLHSMRLLRRKANSWTGSWLYGNCHDRDLIRYSSQPIDVGDELELDIEQSTEEIRRREPLMQEIERAIRSRRKSIDPEFM